MRYFLKDLPTGLLLPTPTTLAFSTTMSTTTAWGSHPPESSFQFDREPKALSAISIVRLGKLITPVESMKTKECVVCLEKIPSDHYDSHFMSHSDNTLSCAICKASFRERTFLRIHYTSLNGELCRLALRSRHLSSPDKSSPVLISSTSVADADIQSATIKWRKYPDKLREGQNTQCIICNADSLLGCLCIAHQKYDEADHFQCHICKTSFKNVAGMSRHYDGMMGEFCRVALIIQHNQSIVASTPSTQQTSSPDQGATTPETSGRKRTRESETTQNDDPDRSTKRSRVTEAHHSG